MRLVPLFLFAAAAGYAQTPLSRRDMLRLLLEPGKVAQVVVTADPAAGGGDFIDFICPVSGLPARLTTPAGLEVGPENAESLGFGWTAIEASANQGLDPFPLAGPGAHLLIRLPPASLPGPYTLTVDAATVTSPTTALVIYSSSSQVAALVSPGAATVKLGRRWPSPSPCAMARVYPSRLPPR